MPALHIKSNCDELNCEADCARIKGCYATETLASIPSYAR